MDDPELLAKITQSIAQAPVLIADGHHRFEVSLQYRRAQREANGDRDGAYDWVMAFVVELAEEELSVLPIHRLIDGLPVDFSLTDAFDGTSRWPRSPSTRRRSRQQMAAAGSLTLITPVGTWMMTPRPSEIARCPRPRHQPTRRALAGSRRTR